MTGQSLRLRLHSEHRLQRIFAKTMSLHKKKKQPTPSFHGLSALQRVSELASEAAQANFSNNEMLVNK